MGLKLNTLKLPVVDINCYDKIGQQSDLEGEIASSVGNIGGWTRVLLI